MKLKELVEVNLSRVKTDVKLNEFLFGLAFYPWLIAWLFTSTFYKDLIHPYGIIRIWEYVGLFFLLLKFITGKSRVKTLIIIPIILLIGFIVSHDNGNASFVAYTLTLVYSSRDIHFRNLVRNTMICQIAVVGFVVGSSILGIIPNELTLTYSGGVIRSRYGLGFSYTSFTPNYFLSILLEYVYLKGEKYWTIKELLVCVLLNIVIYKYTDTRLTFIMAFALLLIIFLRKIVSININFKFLKYLLTLIYPIMAFITYWLTVKFDSRNSLLSLINNFSSQRLRFGQEGLRIYPPRLFGTHIQWDSSLNSYFYVDSSYINILISYGIVIFFLTVISYSIIMKKVINSRDKTLLMVLLFWSVRACIDPQLFLLWFNPFLFLIARTFSDERKGIGDDITYMCVK